MTALCNGEIIPPSHFMTSYVQQSRQNRRSYQTTIRPDQIESRRHRLQNRIAAVPEGKNYLPSLPKGSIKREATEIFSKDQASKVILDSILFLSTISTSNVKWKAGYLNFSNVHFNRILKGPIEIHHLALKSPVVVLYEKALWKLYYILEGENIHSSKRSWN